MEKNVCTSSFYVNQDCNIMLIKVLLKASVHRKHLKLVLLSFKTLFDLIKSFGTQMVNFLCNSRIFNDIFINFLFVIITEKLNFFIISDFDFKRLLQPWEKAIRTNTKYLIVSFFFPLAQNVHACTTFLVPSFHHWLIRLINFLTQII